MRLLQVRMCTSYDIAKNDIFLPAQTLFKIYMVLSISLEKKHVNYW